MSDGTMRRVRMAGAAVMLAAGGLAHGQGFLQTVNVLDAGRGDVPRDFRIGTFEVTNDQYAAFLNAVAAGDLHAVYSEAMGTAPEGGILRSGEPGSYSYAVKPGFRGRPVTFVRWNSALRFCNWMHNGRPGTDAAWSTETGAYTLREDEADTYFNVTGRNQDARWFLPRNQEWRKAAKWDPERNDGAGGFWLFATRSDTPPTPATVDGEGVVTNPGVSVANFARAANWNGSAVGNVTACGACGSPSPWGAFDLQGNVSEWSENTVVVLPTVRGHVLNGGSFQNPNSGVPHSLNTSVGPVADWPDTPELEGEWMGTSWAGFRVARLCAADANGDRAVDFLDFAAFVEQFEAGDALADIDMDGSIDFFDFDAFVGAFEAGC